MILCRLSTYLQECIPLMLFIFGSRSCAWKTTSRPSSGAAELLSRQWEESWNLPGRQLLTVHFGEYWSKTDDWSLLSLHLNPDYSTFPSSLVIQHYKVSPAELRKLYAQNALGTKHSFHLIIAVKLQGQPDSSWSTICNMQHVIVWHLLDALQQALAKQLKEERPVFYYSGFQALRGRRARSRYFKALNGGERPKLRHLWRPFETGSESNAFLKVCEWCRGPRIKPGDSKCKKTGIKEKKTLLASKIKSSMVKKPWDDQRPSDENKASSSKTGSHSERSTVTFQTFDGIFPAQLLKVYGSVPVFTSNVDKNLVGGCAESCLSLSWGDIL